MGNIWDEFKDKVDNDQLQKDVAAAANNEFKEVPAGTYRVKVDKMEPSVSKAGKPMVTIWFEILHGEFKKQKIFYNQVVDNGWGIHNNNEFLKSMDLDCVADVLDSGKSLFQTMPQYAALIMEAAEEIDECGLTFDLKYTEGKNGFHNYEITDVFEG